MFTKKRKRDGTLEVNFGLGPDSEVDLSITIATDVSGLPSLPITSIFTPQGLSNEMNFDKDNEAMVSQQEPHKNGEIKQEKAERTIDCQQKPAELPQQQLSKIKKRKKRKKDAKDSQNELEVQLTQVTRERDEAQELLGQKESENAGLQSQLDYMTCAFSQATSEMSQCQQLLGQATSATTELQSQLDHARQLLEQKEAPKNTGLQSQLYPMGNPLDVLHYSQLVMNYTNLFQGLGFFSQPPPVILLPPPPIPEQPQIVPKAK